MVVLFDAQRARGDALKLALEAADCEVARVSGFLEAVTCLVRERPTIFVVRLPSNELVGNALIAEARRALPRLAVVTIGCAGHSQRAAVLERLGVASVLGAGVDTRRAADTVLGLLRAVQGASHQPAPALK